MALAQPGDIEVAFESFKKIPRLFREIVITEKIDGTNAQIIIDNDPQKPLLVGSRNRWIYPGKTTDNYGFAAWVQANEESLRRLGPGRHYGEWWGVGIARGYALAERRWSLFNATQWTPEVIRELKLPSNVGVVPTLGTCNFDTTSIDTVLDMLKNNGSYAAPGYMNPEGIVVFHKASGQLFKYTTDGDAVHEKKRPSPEEA